MASTAQDHVAIAAICFAGSGMEELGRRWRAVGARKVSFGTPQLFENNPKTVRAMLDAADQAVATICHPFLLGAWKGKDDDPEPARGRLMRAIDIAVILGSPTIYMSTGARGPMSWQEAAEFFATAIAPCRAYAREAGIWRCQRNVAVHGGAGNDFG